MGGASPLGHLLKSRVGLSEGMRASLWAEATGSLLAKPGDGTRMRRVVTGGLPVTPRAEPHGGQGPSSRFLRRSRFGAGSLCAHRPGTQFFFLRISLAFPFVISIVPWLLCGRTLLCLQVLAQLSGSH